MSCHSQIWTNSPLLEPVRESYETNQPIKWNQVNKLPEFAHINHSIHIARGINCNTCHGPVNNMHITWKGRAFQMQWCLQCHRAPEKYLYRDSASVKAGLSPREQVFNLYWKYQEYGSKGLSPTEQDLIAGDYDGTLDSKQIAEGKKLVNEYGVKVQQLADCSVCHY